MTTKQASPNAAAEAADRKRKGRFLLALPLVIVPFVSFALWQAGLGSGSPNAAPVDPTAAYRPGLPDPDIEQPASKKDAYDLTERDAAAQEKAMERDPNAEFLRDTSEGVDPWDAEFAKRSAALQMKVGDVKQDLAENEKEDGKASSTEPNARASRKRSSGRDWSTGRKASKRSRGSGDVAPMAAREDAKLAELRAAVDRMGDGSHGLASGPAGVPGFAASALADDTPSRRDSIAAAQLSTLDRITERALLLSKPELADAKLEALSRENRGRLYPVDRATATEREVDYFGNVATARRDSAGPSPASAGGGFFDTSDDDPFARVTVPAQIHSTQTIVDGSSVKMRLLEDVYLDGERIAANNFVYGTASLKGDRLAIDVASVNHRGNIYNVGLSAYDLDGLEGIPVPGAIERQVAKREAARSSRSAASALPSRNVGTQIAADGARALQEVVSRKATLVKVEVKAGHRVILRNAR